MLLGTRASLTHPNGDQAPNWNAAFCWVAWQPMARLLAVFGLRANCSVRIIFAQHPGGGLDRGVLAGDNGPEIVQKADPTLVRCN